MSMENLAKPGEPNLDIDATGNFSDTGRNSFERVAEEFAAECRKGVAHSISEYERKYPEHADRIRELLPTVALMEQLKRNSTGGTSETVTGLPGERLGEFLVIRELGRGGMGTVYKAVQESLGRHVALKVIHNVHLNAKRLQRFQREAQAVAQLHHTNIVPIFGVGEHDGLPYYAMQYIQGTGLDGLVDRWRKQGVESTAAHWRLVANLGMQAAEGLEHAHAQGILHRDIKPANLLIDEHDTIWITDFGLAKLSGHDDLTATGDILGTLRYLPPEGLRGESDARSDIYSLGLTLYELLTLNAPFGELSPSELIRHVNEEAPVRPRKLAPAIPGDLETIVLKSIAREPAHRYQTAGELAADLRRFLEDRPIQARRATMFERAWRWSRRNRLAASMASAAALATLVALGVGWAGYATTAQALHRSDENVKLSLDVFGELFDKLAANDQISTPPLGVTGGPRGREGPPPGTGNDPPFDEGPDPNGPDRRFGPGGPAGFGPPVNNQQDTELLESVLSFYDRFAGQNAANPRLEGEAAWAYRKVGALYERLGRDAEARQAYDRAIAMLETLASRYPREPDYRFKLVQTFDMADPHSAEPDSLERTENWLNRARTLVNQLIADAPDEHDYQLLRVRIMAKLGVVLRRLSKFEAAAACDREAITYVGELIQKSPEISGFRVDRATTRESLALVELERGRTNDAREQINLAADELRFLIQSGQGYPPLDIRLNSLAEIYRKLGDNSQALEMEQLLKIDEQADHRPPPGLRGKRTDLPGSRPRR